MPDAPSLTRVDPVSIHVWGSVEEEIAGRCQLFVLLAGDSNPNMSRMMVEILFAEECDDEIESSKD